MGRPWMTDEQREMAVALLVDALRKDGHLRARAEDATLGGDILPSVGTRGRHEAARRYVKGMVDLLAVLFADGRRGADACLAAAQARLGEQASNGRRVRNDAE